MSASPVRFTIWSDFLCPWCYVTAVRLDEVRREVGDVVTFEWRSFALRPSPKARPLDAFTRYTEGWARCADAEPRASFHTWSGEHAPPSHSMPCLVAGKAVSREFGDGGFDVFHLALMRAYFSDNRTISDREVILDVASGVRLDAHALSRRLDDDHDALEAAVVADHRDALSRGIAAVPTVVIDDEYMLQGAMSVEQYRKVVARLAG